jgi:chemotaxis protein MotA
MAIVGVLVVLGGVIGGFLMAGGSLGVLFQPSEFIVIGGAAIGGLLVSVPIATLKQLIQDIIGIMQGKMGPSKETYIQTLLLLNELFQMARKDGIIALESHVK